MDKVGVNDPLTSVVIGLTVTWDGKAVINKGRAALSTVQSAS